MTRHDIPPATKPEGRPPPSPGLTDPGERRGDMLTAGLRQTGKTVSVMGFGGSHLARSSIEQATSIRLGMALNEAGYCDKAFLMTKVGGRNKDIAQTQLDRLLSRLRTDCLDLWMFHEVLRHDHPDRIFAPHDGGDAGARVPVRHGANAILAMPVAAKEQRARHVSDVAAVVAHDRHTSVLATTRLLMPGWCP